MERDLWNGADVRWVGPESTRAGVSLQPGDRAVVVDAGRHHVTSFGSLSAPFGTRPPRPGRGVTIRLDGGSEVAVPRRHLELVAPDHPLALEPDDGQAAWWLDQLDRWGSDGFPVGSLVPASFPAVCQVLHPWFGPDGEPIRWQTVAQDPGLEELRERYQTREGLVQAFAERRGLGSSTGDLDPATADAVRRHVR